MDDNRQTSNDQAREEYSTPYMKRFVFETNDLIQASEFEPAKGDVAFFSQDGSDGVSWD